MKWLSILNCYITLRVPTRLLSYKANMILLSGPRPPRPKRIVSAEPPASWKRHQLSHPGSIPRQQHPLLSSSRQSDPNLLSNATNGGPQLYTTPELVDTRPQTADRTMTVCHVNTAMTATSTSQPYGRNVAHPNATPHRNLTPLNTIQGN